MVLSGVPRQFARFVANLFQSMTVEPASLFYYFSYSVYTLGVAKLLLQKTCFPGAEPAIDALCLNNTLEAVASVNSSEKALKSPFTRRVGYDDVKNCGVLPRERWIGVKTTEFSGKVSSWVLEESARALEANRRDKKEENRFQFLSPEDVNTMRSVLREALTAIVMILAGAWRDWTGLTFPLLALSISGLTLSAVVSLISSCVWAMPPMLTAVLESLSAGAGGGWHLLHLSTYCHLSCRTSAENRTTRFTWLMVSMTTGTLIGDYVSGNLLTALGYRWFFVLVIAVKLMVIALGFIFMKEKRRPPPEGQKFFNLQKFLVPFNRKGYNPVSWMMISNSWLLHCASEAEGSAQLLFAETKFPNEMNVINYGHYMAYCTAIHFLGLLLYPPLLIRGLKWSDFTITFLSLVIYIISLTGIGFSETVTQLYIFSTFNVMKSSFMVLYRSILSKCVDDDDLGIYFSFIGVGEGFIPLGFLYLYNYIFKLTISTWPGAYHLITAGIGLVMLTNICIATYLYKNKCSKSILKVKTIVTIQR